MGGGESLNRKGENHGSSSFPFDSRSERGALPPHAQLIKGVLSFGCSFFPRVPVCRVMDVPAHAPNAPFKVRLNIKICYPNDANEHVHALLKGSNLTIMAST
ncbi:hypothetical protein CDAR_566761 [Caerostris darwini]|uniref:Uncharacterized protein n=1 Tax=Caerostris darwini TaxID=1538125 RepID=A0AAV4UDU2_9ARAC|nr:hypothetical protein CDAR_566761 [Caerostris darwini]